MASPRLLLSGDYWHADFRDLVARMSVPATLTPLDQIAAMDTQRFSLIIIAQSRSNQFNQATIDSIITNNPLAPVVMLLGSWCEGERRSDKPVTGVKRVFWHQWQGRFDDFSKQMDQQGISLWHSPVIETDADRVKATQKFPQLIDEPVIGISALNQQTYDALGQAIVSLGGRPKWVERTSRINLSASVSTICIDADSADPMLNRRIQWVQKQVEHARLIVLMNFPRRQEVEKLKRSGVALVISKPFELADLLHAIKSTIGDDEFSQNGDQDGDKGRDKTLLQRPAFSKRRSPTKKAE